MYVGKIPSSAPYETNRARAGGTRASVSYSYLTDCKTGQNSERDMYIGCVYIEISTILRLKC